MTRAKTARARMVVSPNGLSTHRCQSVSSIDCGSVLLSHNFVYHDFLYPDFPFLPRHSSSPEPQMSVQKRFSARRCFTSNFTRPSDLGVLYQDLLFARACLTRPSQYTAGIQAVTFNDRLDFCMIWFDVLHFYINQILSGRDCSMCPHSLSFQWICCLIYHMYVFA